jgi:hypothetical protein
MKPLDIAGTAEASGTPVQKSYNDGPAGVALLGMVSEAEQGMLQKALESGRSAVRDAWEASAEKREIFWINIWQRSGGVDMLPIEGVAEIDSWARGLAGQSFAGQKMECDGYGFIVNPVGSRAQPWHVDYTLDCSTLFIPLTRLTPENCLQYAILPPEAPRSAVASALANLDVIALDPLVEACDYVSVRQLLARPFSIIKLDFGTIHRGVANTGGFERIMFWISFSRCVDLLPLEPMVQVIR